MISAFDFGLLEPFDRLVIRYKGSERVALVMRRHQGNEITCRVHRHNRPGWLARPESIARQDVIDITRAARLAQMECAA